MLIHKPYGREHPYEQELTERFPRDPHAGQKVTLGVTSSPPGTLETVWCEWRLEGEAGLHDVEGQWQQDDDASSYWHIELPPFSEGDLVRYRVLGRMGEEQLQTGEYAFGVSGWHHLTTIEGFTRMDEGLVLICTTDLNDLKLRLDLSFHQPNQIRFEWSAVETTRGISGSPSPAQEEKFSLVDKETEIVEFRHVDITLKNDPPRIAVKQKDGREILRETQPLAILTGADRSIIKLRQHFNSPPDEAFYGFGERYNALNQRGNILDNIVYDQWECQGLRTYFPNPFFLSSNHYGIFIDTNRNVEFDLCSSRENIWSYEAVIKGTERLTYHLWASRDPKDIITSFTQMVGKPKLPPHWAFGLWMSSNCWNSQERIIEEVNKSLNLQIPASVIVVEAWSDETTIFLWNESEYPVKPSGEHLSYGDISFLETGKWPDPKGMVDYLNSIGMALVLWQVPVIKSLHEKSKNYGLQTQHRLNNEYVIQNKLCLSTKSGTPYQIPDNKWFAGSLVIDFTNDKAVSWWMAKRRYLVEEIGVAGFKTDGGEHVVMSDVISSNQLQGDELRNLYPKQYLKAYSEFLEAYRGNDAVLFSRSGYVGVQKYSCHWAGDQDSTWDTIKECIYAGLSVGLSGVSFWGWDIGGFSDALPSAELYLRSTAIAAFCPIMQFHSIVTDDVSPDNGSNQSYDRTPWNIQDRTGDESVIPIFRFFTNLRMNLMPYILHSARQSSDSGLPLMTALPIEFPDDMLCRKFPFQYLFGRELLVAPVVEPDQESMPVYLPSGAWCDFWSGETVAGGQVLECPTPMDRIPVFVRSGAILPMNLGLSLELGSSVGNAVDCYEHLCFKVFGPMDGSWTWHDAVSHADLLFHGKSDPDGEFTLDVPELPVPCIVIMPGNKPRQVRLDGAAMAELGSAQTQFRQGWRYSLDSSETHIYLPLSTRVQKLQIFS